MSPPARRVAKVEPLRVVLGEDDYLVREGITQLLRGEETIELVAVAHDLHSVADAVDEHEPDVLVTDIRMPPSGTDEGLRIARQLREEHPRIGVVILSQHAEPEYAVALLDDGSAGRAYLLKERLSDVAQLVHAIHEVAGGGSVIDPKVVDQLMSARDAAARSALEQLTPTERRVLAQLAQGKSNAGIAAAIGTTPRSVEKHIAGIFGKLRLESEPNVHRRVKAALVFLSAPHS
jgi:DNA-binding NarL/FixJ family response regulator